MLLLFFRPLVDRKDSLAIAHTISCFMVVVARWLEVVILKYFVLSFSAGRPVVPSTTMAEN